ncbi:indole-3-glycerol phosphate synthase TrpC [Robertkochia aurantiaca]|uniref:indole-3-glycerol phosphate synthase TrpC n=1 Tax=Robertkochia aurantiaca TaxID=2873700 RepID=UPI001CCFE3B9|nr:indole-3-glycerol phosphate synthase TrpC [Robertkochia sp. 3YJGBD-33]
MTILENILIDKRKEVDLRKSLIPSDQLERSVLFDRTSPSLAAGIRSKQTGIIAEHKRRSPSKSVINQSLNTFDVCKGYEKAGAAGISVLTDVKYFGGSLDDLLLARASSSLPLLRKEFMIDPYQVIEAKAYGADVILLIAAALNPKDLEELARLTKELGMDVLLEVHNLEELQRYLNPYIDLVGVNNRNLKTFELSLETSMELSKEIPDEFVKVSESGISNAEAIKELTPFGFSGFLIGERFMATGDPGAAAAEFINDLK